nr:hypothetical protein [uncultured Cardiobacterium sp.]
MFNYIMPPPAKSHLSRETKKPSLPTLAINALPRATDGDKASPCPVDKAWNGDSKKQAPLRNPASGPA